MDFIKNEGVLDIIHYKIAIRLKDIIHHRTKPNIIIHGVHKSGKSKIIQCVLKETFGPSMIIKNDKVTSFQGNKYYFLFNVSDIINKNNIISFIKDIVKKYDHFNNTIKYVILEDFNHISFSFQNILKVIIEKSFQNARFIIITNKIGSIHDSIHNSFYTLRVPLPTKYDKYIYLKELLNKKGIHYNQNLLLNDCSSYDINVLINLYLISYEYKLTMQNENKVYNICKIFQSSLNVKCIRELANYIKNININIVEILKGLMNILPKIYSVLNTDPIKLSLIIKEISRYEYIIRKSYREIIPIESLIIKLYRILYNEGLI